MLSLIQSKLNRRVAVFAAAVMSLGPWTSPAAKALTYSIDDGTAEGAQGGLGAGQFFIFLNEFSIVGGNNVINAISIAWGTPNFPDPTLNGIPYTVVLWSDPNGDGLPHDAVVLATAEDTIAASGTDTFITTIIPATAVLTQNFFVGYRIAFQGDQFGNAYDSTPPTFMNRSFNDAQGDINDLSGANEVPIPVNWLIRAEAIPEPSTYALIGLGLTALVRLLARRRIHSSEQ